MSRDRWRWRAIALALMLPAVTVYAQDEAPPTSAPPAATQQLVEELNRALESRDAVILDLLGRAEELEKKASASDPERRALVEVPEPAPNEGAAESARMSTDEELDEADKLAQTALERTLIESGRLLLPAGVMEIQPSVGYGLTTINDINIDCLLIQDILCIGDIDSRYVRSESFFSNWNFRLGLPWDMQFDARVPLVYDISSVGFANGGTERARTFDLGDVELSLSRQLLKEEDWRPAFLAALRWKTTTGGDPFDLREGSLASGTGFEEFQLSLTGVKVRDPVVLFSNLNYTTRLSDRKADIGKVEPGNIIGMQLGLAVALNLETSLNFGWSQSWVEDTTVDGSTIRGTFERPGSLRIGATYVPAAGRSIDFGLAMGITEGAPDLEVSLSFPMRLPYRIPFGGSGR